MRTLKPLTAAAVLILVPFTPARAQAPPPPTPQAPVYVTAPQHNEIVYVPHTYSLNPTGCADAYAGLGAKTSQFSWGPGLIGRHLGDTLNRRHVWTITHEKFQFFRRKKAAEPTCYATAQATPCPSAQSYQVTPAPPVVAPAAGKAAMVQGEEAPPAPGIRDLTPIAEAGPGDTVRFLPTGRSTE